MTIQINFRYVSGHVLPLSGGTKRHVGWTEPSILELGGFVRKEIFRMCAPKIPGLTEDDVVWLPVPYFPGYISPSNCFIQLELPNTPDIKAAFSEEVLRMMKRDILGEISRMSQEGEARYVGIHTTKAPLIGTKFVDPDNRSI